MPTAGETANRKSMTEVSSLRNNSSWSDVRKYGASRSGASGSVSSVESDITVLVGNASRGSISVISESSDEKLKTSVTNNQGNKTVSDVSGDTSDLRSDNSITDESGITWTKGGKGLLTPVGSPLTNSVCSSMVSSVYENTITGSGEDVPPPEDDVQVIKEDIIAESMPIRRSKNIDKSRQSNNRKLVIHDESSQSILENNGSVTVENTVPSSNKREASIYDISDPSEKEKTKYDNAPESIVPSIYDSSVSDDSVEVSRDSLLRNDRSSHDDLSTNQITSDYLSPRRRRSSRSRSGSRSRSRSQNRSAIYVDNDINISGADSSEFLSEPSLITEREFRNNQSSESVNVTNKSLESVDQLTEKLSQSLNESSTLSEVSQQSTSSVQLPWEQSVNQSPDKSTRDESLNHDELVNIDHK